MKNLNKLDFESAWRKRFEEINIEPDEKVWVKIDAALANRESNAYKRKILFLELLAAASLIFALSIGFLLLQDRISHPTDNTTLNEDKRGNVTGNQLPSVADKIETEVNGEKNGLAVAGPNERGGREMIHGQTAIIKSKKPDSMVTPEHENSGRHSALSSDLINSRKLALISEPEMVIDTDLPYLNDYETSVITNTTDKKQLWAGVDIGSGIFDPNISYGPRPLFNGFNLKAASNASYLPASNTPGNNSLLEKPRYSPDVSVSYGINVGYELGNNWIIQGGLGYQVAKSSASVNTFIESASGNERYAYQTLGASNFDIQGISAINSSQQNIVLDNVYEFIAIPVTAGYILYDRNIRWIINGGVAPEFLVRNNVMTSDDFLSTLNLDPGRDSPYKSIYLNGIIGTSLNVSILNNYRLSIFPSYNFGLGYLTKEDAGFNSRPTYFIVNGSISYLFK